MAESDSVGRGDPSSSVIIDGSATSDDHDDDWSRRVEMDESQLFSPSALVSIENDEDGNHNNNHRAITMNGDGTEHNEDEDRDGMLQEEGRASNFTGSTTTNQSSTIPPRSGPTSTTGGPNSSTNGVGGGLMDHHRGHQDDDDDDHLHRHHHHDTTAISGTQLAPQREEPTLKEKLVERERQRRVETERARLKRQFALSSNGGGGSSVADGLSTRENGSVAGTVGEGSSVDHHEADEDDELSDDQKLPYPMERFLKDQKGNNVNGQDDDDKRPPRRPKREDPQQGVVMERFLKEPLVPERPSNVDRTVSFDMEPPTPSSTTTLPTSTSDVGAAATTAMGMAMTSTTTAPPSMDEDSSRGGVTETRQPHATLSSSMPSFTDTDDDVRVSVEAMVSMASVEANASTDTDGTASLRDNDDDDDNNDDNNTNNSGRRRNENDEVPTENHHHHHHHTATFEQDSPSVDRSATSEQPRVLRLTEAEIQEMAAIEEASRSNAPPSERGDISESSFVGEMVADMGGTADPAGTLSQGTPTTAMESGSLISGNRSAPASLDDEEGGAHGEDQNSLDGMGTASISSHLMVSSSAGSVSVTANPPSEFAGEERAPSSPIIPDMIHPVPTSPLVSPERLDDEDSDHHRHRHQSPTLLLQQQDTDTSYAPAMPMIVDDIGPPIELDASSAANAGIVNRTQRPGMMRVNLQPQTRPMPGGLATTTNAAASSMHFPSSPLRRTLSAPDKINFDVDGFDFDKHAAMSPRSGLDDSLRDLPEDCWSPVGKMAVSPLHARKLTPPLPPSSTTFMPRSSDMIESSSRREGTTTALYGSSSDVVVLDGSPAVPDLMRAIAPPDLRQKHPAATTAKDDHHPDEKQPLLRDNTGVPSETVSQKATIDAGQQHQMEKYATSPSLAKVFPERMVALTFTLIIEIPVLLMVSGGSGRLCGLLGRSKYQLLMGLLPLASAISGNVALQTSNLTTRAMAHGLVTSESYMPWLWKEIVAATYLGVCMGFLLFIIAFFASSFDLAFGIAIMIAQFISILSAGCTGALTPIFGKFFVRRDADKWGGLLETAIQDIVGSFAMVVVSYKILEFLGPLEVDPNDLCG